MLLAFERAMRHNGMCGGGSLLPSNLNGIDAKPKRSGFMKLSFIDRFIYLVHCSAIAFAMPGKVFDLSFALSSFGNLNASL